jgi:UDP-N-acetylmuramate: L-alanyl-gamma-D-glutamyl-meso-diaminopimelate ligase
MKIHFIAIGGAAMHNLALALHHNGDIVTGSDDEIYEPSKSRLDKYNLLPKAYGWYPDKITEDIDAIILGMHAKIDNPELLKAQELGLKIYSYPSYIAEKSKNKRRVVVAGSHGKTTTTSIIMHILKDNDVNFDYLVGSIIDGFETMVKLSNAPIIILEGDEYLSSPLDRTPKMLHYKPHLSIITGIAWDHVNVFPTFEMYVEQFELFINSHVQDNKIYYFNQDDHLSVLANNRPNMVAYNEIDADENHNVVIDNNIYHINMIGKHNYQNIRAAQLVCNDLGITDHQFFNSLETFSGAKKRMQLMSSEGSRKVYLDFAHSPSKVTATVKAVRDWYPNHELIVFYELHTYSSFQEEFLPLYKNSLTGTDVAYVVYNENTLKIKKVIPPKDELIQVSFQKEGLKILKTKEDTLEIFEKSKLKTNSIILIMTSGNFFNILL